MRKMMTEGWGHIWIIYIFLKQGNNTIKIMS